MPRSPDPLRPPRTTALPARTTALGVAIALTLVAGVTTALVREEPKGAPAPTARATSDVSYVLTMRSSRDAVGPHKLVTVARFDAPTGRSQLDTTADGERLEIIETPSRQFVRTSTELSDGTSWLAGPLDDSPIPALPAAGLIGGEELLQVADLEELGTVSTRSPEQDRTPFVVVPSWERFSEQLRADWRRVLPSDVWPGLDQWIDGFKVMVPPRLTGELDAAGYVRELSTAYKVGGDGPGVESTLTVRSIGEDVRIELPPASQTRIVDDVALALVGIQLGYETTRCSVVDDANGKRLCTPAGTCAGNDHIASLTCILRAIQEEDLGHPDACDPFAPLLSTGGP